MALLLVDGSGERPVFGARKFLGDVVQAANDALGLYACGIGCKGKHARAVLAGDQGSGQPAALAKVAVNGEMPATICDCGPFEDPARPAVQLDLNCEGVARLVND